MAAASPGLLEVALLDRMIDLIVDRERAYDLIVFDTAPTGHTLQLLRMPDAMTTWIQALIRHRRALLEIDRGVEERGGGGDGRSGAGRARAPARAAERLREMVIDRSRTAFVLVTMAERLAIEETARAAELFADTAIDVAGLVVNRVLPDEVEGEFYLAKGAGTRVSRGDRAPLLAARACGRRSSRATSTASLRSMTSAAS